MTLAICHRFQDRIILLSDSRITYGGSHSDLAIKVMPITIKIDSPLDTNSKQRKTKFSSTYGIALAGTFAAYNAIKDFLSIALQNLQFVPSFGELSFPLICSYIMDLYKHVTTRLFKEIEDSETIDFFLCGLCPQSNRLMAAKFSIYYGNQLDKFVPKCQLLGEETVFPVAIGSGEEAFHQYLPTDRSPISIVRALKEVIDDPSIESVGGNIQYGELDSTGAFMIKGIVVPELQADGSPKLNHFFVGGIDVLNDVFDHCNGLHMTGSFLYPWQK